MREHAVESSWRSLYNACLRMAAQKGAVRDLENASLAPSVRAGLRISSCGRRTSGGSRSDFAACQTRRQPDICATRKPADAIAVSYARRMATSAPKALFDPGLT